MCTSFHDLLTWKDHPHLLSKHSITWTTSPLPTSIHCSWQIPWKIQWDSSKKNSGASYSKKPREAKQCLFFLLNVSTSKWRILYSQRNLLPEFQRWLRDALSSSENSFKLHNMLFWARWSLKVGDCILHLPSLTLFWKVPCEGSELFYQLLFILCIKLNGEILLMIINNRQRPPGESTT